MTHIAQQGLGAATRTIIIAVLALIGPLAISPAQAGKADTAFCPCFSATVIDASFEELSGSGVKAIENGAGGSVFCYDGDVAGYSYTLLNFRGMEGSMVNTTVFSEPFPNGDLGCGWSGRPLGPISSQEARACRDEIVNSTAWRIFACPNTTPP